MTSGERAGPPSPVEELPTEGYLKMMGAFPTGVAVVTAIGADGAPRGLTCSSLSSVTLEPPTLLVCVALRSSTLTAMLDGGHFAVNLLHSRGRRAAQVFAAPVADRFAQVAWRRAGPSAQPHLVQDAFATADCRVVGNVTVGDHAIVLGGVRAVAYTEDRPLLYGMRSFAAWAAASSVS